jgi:hypothetical protein
MRGRSRTVSRSLVLAGVAALSLTPLAVAAPAGAAPAAGPPVLSLFGGAATFHVGGRTWVMAFFDFSNSSVISLSASHEFDTWNFFPVPISDLKANVKTGSATFNAHTALAPVAFANLKFTPTSRHKATCRKGSETFFSGRITGSISLAASKSLTFKSAHVVFRGSSLDVDHQCIGPSGSAPCFGGFWGTASATATTVSGDMPGLPGQRKYSVSLFKSVALRAPRNATVTYNVIGTESKPVFASKQKRLSVKAISVVKGSAVLKASGPPSITTSRCTIGRTRYKTRTASYFGSYTSPSGFSARSIIGGLLKVARSGQGQFSVISFKRA